ncbi:ribonuclease P protein component [candidate division TA06 bacterium]|uniref:Ribonuclease P protein component n=1 Tax=candidate division TA06 bacterium TaxID=2250710 RepID=A0A660SBJ8_UNCT6|nr:MAG: ribonuclease P protein component [candidate division TA06 bacterium]
MAGGNTYPKSLRLRKNSEFRAVFLHGQRYVCGSISVFALKEKEKKIGISVSSKKLRKAVERNRVKRILREIVRKEKNSIPNNLHLVFLYNKREVPTYAEIHKDVKYLFQKLQ